MELRRLRILFLFVAFLLCLSVCYVYAQDAVPAGTPQPAVPHTAVATASASTTSASPVLWIAPQHPRFLAPAPMQHLVLDGHARTSTTPVVSRALLSEVETVSRTHRRFLHLGHTKARTQTKSGAMDDDAILQLFSNSELVAQHSAQVQ